MTKRNIVLTIAMLILSIQIADFAQGKDKPDPIVDLQNQINDLQQQINNMKSPQRVMHGIVTYDGERATGAGDWLVEYSGAATTHSYYSIHLVGFDAIMPAPTCVVQQVDTPQPNDRLYTTFPIVHLGIWKAQIVMYSVVQDTGDPPLSIPNPTAFQFVCIQE